MSETPREKDDSAQFDIMAAPDSYLPLIPQADGYYYTASSQGKPVAVVWTDNANGAGILTLQSNETTAAIQKHFMVAAHLEVPAAVAYDLSKNIVGMDAGDDTESTLDAALKQRDDLLSSVEPVTAAGEPDVTEEPDPTADTAPDSDELPPLFISISDDDPDEILELIKSDADGTSIRDNGSWVQIDDNDDNPRIWDVTIEFVNDGAISAFDTAEESGTPATVSDMQQFIVPFGDETEA